MKITKFGHCCLLVEEATLRILTDPGSYSTEQNTVKDIDLVLITHEHADHLHIESLKAVLKNNPQTKVLTNKSVGALLDKERIPYALLEHGNSRIERGVLIEAFGTKHATIYPSLPQVENTGYFIANTLFYPGDALTNPHKAVDILALPVAGPWLTLAQAIDYALEIRPKNCFPVHEGILRQAGSVHRIPLQVLEPHGIRFIIIKEGTTTEF